MNKKKAGAIKTPAKFRGIRVKEEGHSDFLSRGLSYHSIGIDADGLDFWVRNETR